MSALTWKNVPSNLSYEAAKRRTPRDAVGTAYWIDRGQKHTLYVKVGDDRWLCFGGKTIDACLREHATKPGAGGRASDHLIANGLVTSAPKRTASVAAPEKKGRRAPRLSAKQSPDAIWRSLEERGALVIRRAVSAKELAAAERALGFRFPPSYVDIVVRHGAPAIGRSARSRAEDLEFAVLTPKEVVRFTRQLRRVDREMFEDEASLPRVKAQLANAVLFQLGENAGEGYVFLLDTKDSKGEMRIGDYHHDWIEELDWRPSSKAVFRSLSASTLHAAKQIERGLPSVTPERRRRPR